MRHNFNALATVGLLTVVALVAACGGGGSSTDAPAPAAPSALSYPTAPALVVGNAVTPLTPTVTGTVASYSVTPSLPAGLTLNTTTGVISGTPTAVAATAAHTVTAGNAAGSTTTTLSITVNDVAPSIDYGTQTLRFTTGVPLTVTPTVSGGTPVTWTIHPALPSGLAFGTSDGRITGTPADVAALESYLITAANSGGQAQAELTISVDSGVLLELGHGMQIRRARATATRALSQDRSGHWVLWNLATAAMITQGETCPPPGCLNGGPPVDLAGATAVIQTPTGLQIRAASDGAVLAEIPGSFSFWSLASDGTYVVAANATALQAWTRTGDALFTRSGNYSSAAVFPAPAEVRVARGPAGADVIEQIAIPSGAATVGSAFLGTFHSWFLDGERFLTNAGTTVRVYSKAAVQEDIAALPVVTSLTGQGGWFWIDHGNFGVKVYAVGASATPTATYTYGTSTSAVASRHELAVMAFGEGRLRVVDLSGTALASEEYQVPHGSLVTFAASGAASWLLGTNFGVLLDGSTLSGAVKYFGQGQVWSIAGSDARFAIATARGSILHFDASSKELEGTIAFDASQIELSSDGAVLAAAANANYFQYQPDRTLKLYALPGATLIDTRPYTFGSGPSLVEMQLARSGEFVAEALMDGVSPPITRQVTPVAGGAPTFSDSSSKFSAVFRVSPDGSRVALTTDGYEQAAFTVTNLYEDGSLVGAVDGFVVDWLDNGRLLANTYEDSGGVVPRYTGAIISDAAGATLAASALPEVKRAQPLSGDRIYSPERNSIFSLQTGGAIWTGSRAATVGAVAGPWVVFASGSQVRVEPH